MDIDERLSPEAAGARTLEAAEHRHRYHLAASLLAGKRILDLCCGVGYGSLVLAQKGQSVVGVDRDQRAIDTAIRTATAGSGVRFEVADAHDYVRRLEPGDFDAIVCFEGLEHLHDLEAVVRSLVRLTDAGVQAVFSVPNSRAFGERNPHHATDFDYDSALALFDRFERVAVLYQFLAEGSIIMSGDVHEAGDSSGEIFFTERGEPAYANNFVACVNCEPEPEAQARIHLAAAPWYNRQLLNLQAGYADLLRTNARLARSRLGTFDAAAAVRPSYRQYVAYAASWEPIPEDGLERFREARPA